MRKLSFLAVMLLLSTLTFGGGLLTNTNQSAQYIRMMSRNASRDIDAVYFNPAGLSLMQDGWHFAIYNQTIFQDENVNSGFPLLNDGDYLGKVSVPAFPTAFAVYKKENWAFSLGFGPNGGGGSAEFEKGLPSFEIPISKIVPGFSAQNAKDYSAELSFNGSSVFWGIQLGATYKISDFVSVYGGVRYMPSKNVYEGSIKNVQMQVGDDWYSASMWVGDLAEGVTSFANMPTTLQPYLAQGGNYTLAQLEGAGQLSAAQRAGIETGLKLMSLPQAQIDAMNLTQIHGAYTQASPTFQQQALELNKTSEDLTDKEVETEQTGAGFTPIFGMNLNLSEGLNVGIKYEHKTILNLKNTFGENDNYGETLFGKESRSDIPGILSIGLGYKGLEWIEAQLSYTAYFNKGVDWGMNTRDMAVWGSAVKAGKADASKIRAREIEKMGYELGLGLQFNLSEKFAVSVGGLIGDMGVADSYQSDFSYSNPSTTVGAGIMWKVGERLTLDAGFSDTFYKDQTVTYNGDPDLGESFSYKDTYGKTTLDFAVGLSYSIF